MPQLRRTRKHKRKEHKQEVVTGNFDLHYEDIIHKHRGMIVALFASALVLLAVFVPKAVYRTIAEPQEIDIEVETGQLINTQKINLVEDDITASGDSYIEFKLPEF